MRLTHILLYSSDLKASEDFYDKLGFVIAKKTDTHFVARIEELELHCYDQGKVFFKQDVNREKGAGVFIHILVDNVDERYRDLVAKGIKPSGEPKDWEWGNREFAIKDPDGYRIVFYTKL